MIQIGLPALPDSLSVATPPKNMLHSFVDWWRQAFLLVLLHPTRVDCLNCSFESPFAFSLEWLLQYYRCCIICKVSKICRPNLGTEMQHGGESSSMLPAAASLNLAMRSARSKISPNRQPYRDR